MAPLVSKWWLLQVRGIFSLLCGTILVFAATSLQQLFGLTDAIPDMRITFSVYLIASGIILASIALGTFRYSDGFWILAAHSGLLIACGLWILSTEITPFRLIWIVISTTLVSGIFDLLLGRALFHYLNSRLFHIAGIISSGSVLVLILARHAQLWLVVNGLGICTMYYGGTLVLLSLRLHSMREDLHLAHGRS